jgi:hypothetical protein
MDRIAERLSAWFAEHGTLVAWLGWGSLALFLGSLIAVPWLVARIPADYFVERHRPRPAWARRSVAAFLAVRVLRNTAGVVLLVLGIALLVLPGQGLLTIVVAILLLDVPGKRRLVLRLVRRPGVSRALNWIRRRAGVEPLRFDPPGVDPE